MTEVMSTSELRDLALNYLDVASDGTRGRGESDPIYEAITEGRDFGKGYSSCGDLVHWILYRLGIRGHWLNRAEFKGFGWKSGVNISRLAWTCPDVRGPRAGERYEPGDILIVWSKRDTTDAHVLIVRDHEPGTLHSVDGGQPGICRRSRPIDLDGLQLSTKRIRRVLKFRDLIAGAFARNELVLGAEPLGDWLARVHTPETEPPPTLPDLRFGDSGDHVERLQNCLIETGANIKVDGKFGPNTHAAVYRFQSGHGLEDSGVVSASTWELLL